MKHKESDVLRACTDWLEANKVLYIRHNAISPVTCGRPGVYKKVRESQKGGPDLIIFRKLYLNDYCLTSHCGPIAIECKSSVGKLSQAQIDWRERAEKVGLRYVLVREIEDLVRALED